MLLSRFDSSGRPAHYLAEMDVQPFVTPMAIAVGIGVANYLIRRGHSPLPIVTVIGWCFVLGGIVLSLSALAVAPDERLGALALGIIVALVGMCFLLASRRLARHDDPKYHGSHEPRPKEGGPTNSV